MADSTVQFGKSPEEVALQLLYYVANAENVSLNVNRETTRQWILDAYADCLRTVQAPRARVSQT